ncbi:hypothetical protein BC833DRAFT_580676 [Globomyces pollinis-pini]|nr:hypothetical protein BC833DRAFT_580676 [Globomyces pollinis-pini]
MIVVYVLSILSSILGIMGSVWVMIQFMTGKQMLRNLPGLLIFAISWTDLLNSFYYFIYGILDLTLGDFQFWRFLELLFPWATISGCFLGMILSFNTLLVIHYQATVHGLEKWKWVVIIIVVLLPSVLYFLPLQLTYDTPYFSLDVYQNDCKWNNDYLCWIMDVDNLLLLLVSLAMLLSLASYLKIYSLLGKQDLQTDLLRNPKEYAIKRLIMIYCLFQIIIWLPFLLVRIASRFMPVETLPIFFTIDLILIPARGYLHALGVVCASRVVANCQKPMMYMFFLDMNHVMDKPTSSFSITTLRPTWNITLDRTDIEMLSSDINSSTFTKS